MMPKSGDKISVKLGKRFKKHEVISCDSEGWIIFKSSETGGNNFMLHLTIHQNHIKIPKKKEVKPPPKKRGRKKKK